MTLILASTSQSRADLLANAGVNFQTAAPLIDERSAEKPLVETGQSPSDIANVLAEAKALEVSVRFPDAYVLGGDQTLSLDGRQFHKPQNMDQARRHLLAMNGKIHQLNSAVAIAIGGKTIWRHLSVAHMHMRQFSPEFVGRHLADVGEAALNSVGAYQLEGQGIQLFEHIDGDYFTILGLPLLSILPKLRDLGEIDD